MHPSRTLPELFTVTRQNFCRMNTYQVLAFGCLIILCYLQRQAWAAPSQLENAKNFNQGTDVAKQEVVKNLDGTITDYHAEKVFKRQDLEEMSIKEDQVILKNQSHTQKRETSDADYQHFRNVYYIEYTCNWWYFREGMLQWFSVSNTVYEYIYWQLTCTFQNTTLQQEICQINLPRPEPSLSVQQRYDQMDKPMCDDIAYYKYYRVKILSCPWSSQSDVREWICFIDRLISALENLQVSITSRTINSVLIAYI